MPEVEIALRLARSTVTYDVEGEVVLAFRTASFGDASWRIPKYPGDIPATELDGLNSPDGLMSILIEFPDKKEQPRRLVGNRVKMHYPEPDTCCIFNDRPNGQSPNAGVEHHVLIGDGKIEIEMTTWRASD